MPPGTTRRSSTLLLTPDDGWVRPRSWGFARARPAQGASAGPEHPGALNGAGGEERHDVGGVVGGEHRVEGRVEFKPTLVGHGDAGYRRLETEWLP